MEELTDTVEDYHLVVDGVTDSCQDCSDKRLVNFQGEGNDTPQQWVSTDNHDRITGQRYNRAHTICNVAETDQDVQTDGKQSQYDRIDCRRFDVFCDARTYFLWTDDTTTGMVIAVDECFQCDVVGQQRFYWFIQVCFDFRVDIVAFFLNAVVGTDTNRFLIRTDSDNADIGITELACDQVTNLFRFYRLFELYFVVTSTGEVDTFT